MSTEEPCEASTDQDSSADGKENTSAHAVTGMNQKSGKQLANTIRATAGKNDSRYWLPRVFRPVNARGEASPHYSMKVQFRGRRMAFTLGTGNKDAAAKRAAAIYGELLAHGIEATLARRRAQRPEGEDIATIGEYLSAAQSVMAVRPASFAAYAAYLRRIAGDILNLRSAQRAKTKQKRATRQAIENAPVSILTRGGGSGVAAGFCGPSRGQRDKGEIGTHFEQFDDPAGQESVRSQGAEISWRITAARPAPVSGRGVFPARVHALHVAN